MTDWQKLEHDYYMPTFKRIPITLIKGQGAKVWDENDKEYLDFVSGIAVNSLGHCHPVVVKAITEQANTLMHTSNLYYTIPQLKLAELLVKNSCMDKVFICNSGTEATEGAVKLARRYGHIHLNGAYEVITGTGSFHGRTLAMVSASGQSKFQEPYIPIPSGFINVDYNNIEALKAATNERTCAVMMEPIQGESGVHLTDDDYLKNVREWCDQKGILLILDEIQTGAGRTGTLFAYQQYGIEPDIMTLAKGLAGGFPIGAILCKDKASVFAAGEHGSTFGGNPLACATGYAVFKTIVDNDIPLNAKVTGQYLTKRLNEMKQKYNFISDVRGRGLLQAIELSDKNAMHVVMGCLEKGLLVNKIGDSIIRFMPPLVIGRDEVDKAIDILDAVLTDICSAR
ncbi:MAG: acetylornithine transaminase [Dehalococcoidales bacterium]|jgi:predicted acetylornithine/succinylornithine family transaminase